MTKAVIETPQDLLIRHIERIGPDQLDAELVRKLPLEFLKKQCAIPILLEDGVIGAAMADPLNIEAFDTIANILDCPCIRVICPESEIEHAISRCYYHAQGNAGGDVHIEQAAEENTDTANQAQSSPEDLLNIASKAPAVKLVNKILFLAIHSRASDIHIEPYEQKVRIRFRVDGVLHDVLTLPKQQYPAMVSRLKIMANLNIAEHRLPQDGQSRIKIGENMMDIRVSVVPTLGGERVMLRLLDKSSRTLTLTEVGLASDALQTFRELISMPHGIILITGPTGSGKTTTLYAALNELNSNERNILTVEDPIEYQLTGAGQIQVKPKINLTFANCLRHILRQDPDVIMVGEIRDIETAEIAIQASLTGHLVLSTLHTNDAASAVTRLIDMGIEPYLISSSVIAVMAQRLIRLICPKCKGPFTEKEGTISLWNQSEKHMVSKGQFFKGAGCDHCLDTGYFGRTGIFELFVINDDTKDLIVNRSSAHIIKAASVNTGMRTLRDDGLRKALAGETTLEEICRVTRERLTN